MRRRRYAALTTGVIAVAIVITTMAGSAAGGPKTVTFTTVDTITSFTPLDNSPGSGDLSRREVRAGDVLLATARSTINNREVGNVVTHCQMVTDTEAQCQATWRFNGRHGTRKGSLTAAGVLSFGAEEVSRAPIAGGTGRVRGARGEIVRTTVGPGQDKVVFKVLTR
jgi:hypothetical protein